MALKTKELQDYVIVYSDENKLITHNNEEHSIYYVKKDKFDINKFAEKKGEAD